MVKNRIENNRTIQYNKWRFSHARIILQSYLINKATYVSRYFYLIFKFNENFSSIHINFSIIIEALSPILFYLLISIFQLRRFSKILSFTSIFVAVQRYNVIKSFKDSQMFIMFSENNRKEKLITYCFVFLLMQLYFKTFYKTKICVCIIFSS